MCGVWHGRRHTCPVAPRSPSVIALFGPTGVGKTALAIAVADRLRASGEDPVAISADAFQVYRELPILSGAPTEAEQHRLEHLLVGCCGIGEEMSAGRFARRAREAIDTSLTAGRRPIVIGGSGLYLQATLTDLEMRPPLDAGMEARAAEVAAAEPGERRELLASVSPEAARQIGDGDRYRAARAVALAEAGQPAEPGAGFWDATLRHPTAVVGLTRDRADLYARIDARVDAMIAAGATTEALGSQAGASATARKVIGFEELPAGREDAMKGRTRRYAKRQLTWLRRMPCRLVINLSEIPADDAAAMVVQAATAPAE